MKRLILIVVLTTLTMGCGGSSTGPNDTAQPDTAEPDTTEPDTVVPDTAVPDTVPPPPDTATPDVVLPPPDISLPPPDTAPADTNTTDGGSSEPASSCRVALDCTFGCNDDACKEACTEGAELNIVDGVGAVMSCQMEKCTDSTDVPCVLDKCYSDFADCYFDGLTGDNDCKDTKICIEKEGCDDDCINDCLQSADAEAQKNYVKLALCVKEQCGDDPDFNCQKQAELNICSTQWAHCYDF